MTDLDRFTLTLAIVFVAAMLILAWQVFRGDF